ncbi:MAG: class I SAM-dependent methyltransferase, partial [Erysipelotrichaceae bacterium]
MDIEALKGIEDNWEQISKTYEWYNEDTRLTHCQAARVEFLTTIKYIQQALPPKGSLLDIGAGTGIYSLHFAQLGHRVESLELSERNLRLFETKIQ